ncbi:MAG: ribose 5-phosphate isomerase B [candidate division WOR-3 bacterium]
MLKSKVKTIGIGADHRGFRLKEKLKEYLSKQGYRVIDFGVFSEDRADYPLIAFALTKHIKEVQKPKSPQLDCGILICGSGLGMSIAANKVRGIRAALCLNSDFAQRARQHNDANILVLAADFINISEAKKTVKVFLTEQFLGERHKTRIEQITNYEDKEGCCIEK